MNTSVEECALKPKNTEQPTMGVWFQESTGKLYVSMAEEDRGTEVTAEELAGLYRTYRPCFFDAEKTLKWMKEKGVTKIPDCFECLVSQSRLVATNVKLDVAALAWYWWEDESCIPSSELENACYVYMLDDSPEYETLKEMGMMQSYMKRLARIHDFISR